MMNEWKGTGLGDGLAEERDLARERVEIEALKDILHWRNRDVTVRDARLHGYGSGFDSEWHQDSGLG